MSGTMTEAMPGTMTETMPETTPGSMRARGTGRRERVA